MTHKQSKKKEMKRYFRMLAILLIPLVALILGAAAPELWAGHHHDDDDDDDEIPFDEAKIFFELNNTDGDLGIHALVDGDAWKYLEIEDPRDRKMLNIIVRGRLRRQGLTELFFESAEPTFDELSPRRFFRRFPEGEYDIEGITIEGEERESEVWLSHVMPAPAEAYVNGTPAAKDCDVVSLPEVSGPVTISWDQVTMSHPDLGRTNEVIEVEQYQLVVEQVGEGDDFTLSFEFSPDEDAELEVEIPEGLIPEGDTKFEILVREENGNQTAIESCFVVVE